MSNRPITDTWFLARAKLRDGKKFYGAYPGGFLERARVLLGASINEPILHVCGGMARFYPYARGFGPNDLTMDLDPKTEPDILQDARDEWPLGMGRFSDDGGVKLETQFRAYLIDPPYSELDARHYLDGNGEKSYPLPNLLIKRAFEVMEPGQKVGILHYMVPAEPKNGKIVAEIGIIVGTNNRIRTFTVIEKLSN
jgi:hypothetical protein